MFARRAALGLMAIALAALVSATALQAEEKAKKNVHVGTFVSASGDDFTMKGKNGKEHTHTLAKDATVLGADGKECKIGDFKEGDRIRVTTKDDDKKIATKVEGVKKKE